MKRRNPFAKKSGGKRKGAGRPALSFVPVRMNLSLHPVAAQTLKLLCARHSGKVPISRARLVEAMLEHCARDHTFNPTKAFTRAYTPDPRLPKRYQPKANRRK